MQILEAKCDRFLQLFHIEFGHLGVTKSYYTLRSFFSIKNIKKKIEEANRNCEMCLRCKDGHRVKGSKQKIYARCPFERVCSDVFGPFEHEDGNIKGYFILLMDVYSRFTLLIYSLKNDAK